MAIDASVDFDGHRRRRLGVFDLLERFRPKPSILPKADTSRATCVHGYELPIEIR